MLRIVISFVVAFAAAALGGRGSSPAAAHEGRAVHQGDRPHLAHVEAGDATMGGLMFIIGSAAAVLLLGWPDFAAGRFGGGFVPCSPWCSA